jgi:hypothetical protein
MGLPSAEKHVLLSTQARLDPVVASPRSGRGITCKALFLGQCKSGSDRTEVATTRILAALLNALIHRSDPWPLPGHPEAMKMEPSPALFSHQFARYAPSPHRWHYGYVGKASHRSSGGRKEARSRVCKDIYA